MGETERRLEGRDQRFGIYLGGEGMGQRQGEKGDTVKGVIVKKHQENLLVDTEEGVKDGEVRVTGGGAVLRTRTEEVYFITVRRLT